MFLDLTGICYQVTGRCTCTAGYQGSTCAETCSPGFYGSGCSSNCQCVYGTCNPIDGSCTCDPGYTGTTCTELCPEGWSSIAKVQKNLVLFIV